MYTQLIQEIIVFCIFRVFELYSLKPFNHTDLGDSLLFQNSGILFEDYNFPF